MEQFEIGTKGNSNSMMATISSTREPAHGGDSRPPSSKDTDSLKSYSKTDSLLSPNTSASTPNYKATEFPSDTEARPHLSDETSNDITVDKVTKGTALIISLLLVGKFYQRRAVLVRYTNRIRRRLHFICGWHPRTRNIWHYRF